jgi:hypothetical protein
VGAGAGAGVGVSAGEGEGEGVGAGVGVGVGVGVAPWTFTGSGTVAGAAPRCSGESQVFEIGQARKRRSVASQLSCSSRSGFGSTAGTM